MAEKHPYMSGSGGLVQAVNQLRSSFPAQVTAETLKKLGIAPNNETYVLNILRFIKVIDEAGKETEKAARVFSKHSHAEFQQGFEEMVKAAYVDLFSLHGDAGWTLPDEKLISYFRGSDHTSAIVGQRQAGTFQALAGLSGHGEVPPVKSAGRARATQRRAAPPAAKKMQATEDAPPLRPLPHDVKPKGGRDVGLTVRIEINLPAAGDQETYDRIFKSIRENLLGAE